MPCAELDAAVRALQQVMVDQAVTLEHDPDAGVHAPAACAAGFGRALDAVAFLAARARSRTTRCRRTLHRRSAAWLRRDCRLGVIRFPGCFSREALASLPLSQNSIDAVGDRDFVAELLFVVALIGAHLSRLAEDLILYGSSEFGFVKFGEAFTTGSSMMPQKRNPDALELARGSGARATRRSRQRSWQRSRDLPSGYNKDLQDDKRALFDAVDLILARASGRGGHARTRFASTRSACARRCRARMMATDLADYLVEKGATFRDAHSAIGSLIRESERDGCELDALPITSFKAAHPLFGDDVLDWLEPSRSVARRDVPGGTGPSAVSAQLRTARAALWPVTEAARGNELVLSAV